MDAEVRAWVRSKGLEPSWVDQGVKRGGDMDGAKEKFSRELWVAIRDLLQHEITQDNAIKDIEEAAEEWVSQAVRESERANEA